MEHNQQKKKSKQNITRDIEVKNNLTIARGEWGEWSIGATIKDTRTKSRGRVEVAFKVEHPGLALKMLELVEVVREEIFFLLLF